MKQNGSLALFQYWNRLRDGRPAPKRTEIEPADIKSLLGDTFILESDMRGEAVFRLAGTRVCATYGRELKGFAFTSLWRESDRKLISKLTASVFQSNAVVAFDFEGSSRIDRSTEFEFILLPLEGGHENRRCLGALSAGLKPFWLGSDPVTDARMGSVRLIDPDQDPLFLKNRPAMPVPSLEPDLFPEAPVVTLETPAPAPSPRFSGRRIRHLLVLDGGRQE